MALITELDVVNRCIATMGELPINSLEGTRNPIVSNARNAFKDLTIEEQARGWWFNIETISLSPQDVDANGIGVYRPPTDVLSLSTQDDFNPAWLTIRSRKLYNSGTGQYHVGGNSMKVRIVRLVPFDDLPYNAQRLIRDATVLKFQMDYDGDELKIQEASQAYTAAYANCMADHIRSVKPNFLYKGGNATRLVSMRYPTSATGRNR